MGEHIHCVIKTFFFYTVLCCWLSFYYYLCLRLYMGIDFISVTGTYLFLNSKVLVANANRNIEDLGGNERFGSVSGNLN